MRSRCFVLWFCPSYCHLVYKEDRLRLTITTTEYNALTPYGRGRASYYPTSPCKVQPNLAWLSHGTRTVFFQTDEFRDCYEKTSAATHIIHRFRLRASAAQWWRNHSNILHSIIQFNPGRHPFEACPGSRRRRPVAMLGRTPARTSSCH